ncbi:RcpC/CpaB family pilus assembly protein [Paenibacillus sp.]|uniref:RcpC/CpaB family pilus assembly protein n=1 Tax=Paenibacillus sp. TaxID=58172 RepID=UPI0028118412|nr:RcpC/CpaB family pilus assembly protein [Paenibacillus sp.]
MRRWLVTGLGVLLMAASVYGFARYAEHAELDARTVEAIMPTRLIASGETVDASMVRRVRIAEAALAADALRDEADIIGRSAVAPIGPNETFASWKLADRQLTPGAGERYVSFPTDDVKNVSNMLRRGDLVDVWVEFDAPATLGGVPRGALKVIEGLRVASVRSTEGAEITDAAPYDAPFQSAARQRDRVRASADGRPGMNTFIMDAEIYEAYALASLVGSIKLALPEPSLQEAEEARVTDDFATYAGALIEEEATLP